MASLSVTTMLTVSCSALSSVAITSILIRFIISLRVSNLKIINLSIDGKIYFIRDLHLQNFGFPRVRTMSQT